MPVTQETYQVVALEDPEGQWELVRGRLREKPGMSIAHNSFMTELGFELRRQLSPDDFRVRINAGRLRRSDETYFIPDVFVFPAGYSRSIVEPHASLEVYDGPAYLVVEVWSPSTGGYDVDQKFPEYMRRGDLEIWRVHPGDRTVTIWTRRDDGEYDERVVTGGIVNPVALPGVAIDLDNLFNLV